MVHWIVIPTISALMTLTSYGVLSRRAYRRANRALFALAVLFPGALTAVVISNARAETRLLQKFMRREIEAINKPRLPPRPAPTIHRR